MIVRKQRHTIVFMLVVLFILFSTVFYTNISSYTLKTDGKVHGAFEKSPFAKVFIHLDLKGAPPKVSYFEHLFPILRRLGVNGLLIEYEDTFPYYGVLSQLPRKSHYSRDDIVRILQLAQMNELEVVPLLQTFGHLEFVLKHEKFSSLRENTKADDSICPSDGESIFLIKEMLRQTRELHHNSKRIHIGADEAYHVAEDNRCEKRLDLLGKHLNRHDSVEKLKLQHIARVAKLALEANFTEVFAWNDMFDKSSVRDMKKEKLGSLLTPVVWGYAENVLRENYFPTGLFDRLVMVFPQMWFASAYKGANGANQTFINIDRYLANQKSYVKLYEQFAPTITGYVGGIVITGWQRYKHHFPLCELLPISVPSLVYSLVYLNDVEKSQSELELTVQDILNCSGKYHRNALLPLSFKNFTYFPEKEIVYSFCDFYGADAFKLVMKDLRYLRWKKRHIRPRDTAKFKEEVLNLKNNIRSTFQRYFFEEDINEFIQQNIDPI